jgi:group I intron endonuclease
MYLNQGNVPFYIGKGKGDRYRISWHLHGKQLFLQNKIRKIGIDNIKIKFLHKNLMEEQAFYLEEYYIFGYGRRDLGLGSLCNLTNGGEGPSGYIFSKETCQKISEALRGNQNTKGKKHSEETRRKISKANSGKNHPMYGKYISDEHKQKLRESRTGKPSWNKGIPQTLEAKIKNSQNNGKLALTDVIFIRKARENRTYTNKQLAEIFGVCIKTIYKVAHKFQWRYI